jgi:hypothetical protein
VYPKPPEISYNGLDSMGSRAFADPKDQAEADDKWEITLKKSASFIKKAEGIIQKLGGNA